MQITDRFSAEHRVFLQQLNHLDYAVTQGDASPAMVRAMVQVIAIAVERHAAVEETTLFPALARYLGQSVGPLAVMELEHQEIRQTLARIVDGMGTLHADVADFVTVLRDHIAKEDGVLFPLARRLLGEEELERLQRDAIEANPCM